MKEEVQIGGGQVVLSKDEAGYAAVVDSLRDAEWVDIVTYNLSSEDDALLDLLRELDLPESIRIVTNIPKRFSDYYGPGPRRRFREQLRLYRRLLSAEHFISDVECFFNPDNHAKIVMSDRVAYIGSSNFSVGSNGNFECGIVITNSDEISQVRSQIVAPIVEASLPVHVEKLDEARLFIREFWQRLKRPLLLLKDVLEECSYESIDNDLLVTAEETMDLLQYGLYEVEEYPQLDEAMTGIDDGALQEIRELLNDADRPIVRYLQFSPEDRAVAIFSEKYAFEAYDEKVATYQQYASDDAELERQQLEEDAKQDYRRLVSAAKALYQSTSAVKLKIEELAATGWGIDNS